MEEKVFIACSAHYKKRYCLSDYIKGVNVLTYPHLEIWFGDNSPDNSYTKLIERYDIGNVLTVSSEGRAVDRVVRTMNLLREKFLTSNCQWFCSLEQDVIPPPSVFETLLSHKKKVISGLVYHGMAKHVQGGMIVERLPLAAVRQDNGTLRYFTNEEVEKHDGLASVDYVTMGCLLIHRSVLEKIHFRCKDFMTKLGVQDSVWHDFCFCDDAKALGEDIFVDFSVRCAHKLKVNVTNTGFTESIR